MKIVALIKKKNSYMCNITSSHSLIVYKMIISDKIKPLGYVKIFI